MHTTSCVHACVFGTVKMPGSSTRVCVFHFIPHNVSLSRSVLSKRAASLPHTHTHIHTHTHPSPLPSPPPTEGAGVRQLLGVKGASQTDDIWKIRLQLMKPVTWVPLIWGVLCGAAASGHFTWTPENVGKSLLCMTMSGRGSSTIDD